MDRPFHLDLFSGIGGFAIAAQAAGYQTLGFCEREPYAQQILKERFGAVLADAECSQPSGQSRELVQAPGATKDKESKTRRSPSRFASSGSDDGQTNGGSPPRIHPDIFDLDGTEYAGIDLLTGGFPCQPFSVAGKRLGAADDRAIWPQMLRVITESAPTWIIGENVAGIVTMELDNILSDLEAIGYSAWPLVIPACAVDAKHRRDRVWIIGRRNVGDAQSGNGTGRELLLRQGEVQSGGASRGKGASEDTGSGQDVAHRTGTGLEGQQRTQHEGRGNGLADQGQDVADANGERGRLREVHGQDAGNAGESSSTGQGRGIRLTQPAVRGVANGLPQGLDRNDQFCQWPDEDADTPRVTTGIKHRAHRLKGLGNAIVPHVAFEIIQAIRNHG